MCRQARPVRSRRRRTLLARAGAGARRASSLALAGVDATRVPSGEQWRGGGRGEGGRLCWRAQVLAPVAWQSQRRSQDVPLLARAGAGTRRVQSSKCRGDVADEEVRAGGCWRAQVLAPVACSSQRQPPASWAAPRPTLPAACRLGSRRAFPPTRTLYDGLCGGSADYFACPRGSQVSAEDQMGGANYPK